MCPLCRTWGEIILQCKVGSDAGRLLLFVIAEPAAQNARVIAGWNGRVMVVAGAGSGVCMKLS